MRMKRALKWTASVLRSLRNYRRRCSTCTFVLQVAHILEDHLSCCTPSFCLIRLLLSRAKGTHVLLCNVVRFLCERKVVSLQPNMLLPEDLHLLFRIARKLVAKAELWTA